MCRFAHVFLRPYVNLASMLLSEHRLGSSFYTPKCCSKIKIECAWTLAFVLAMCMRPKHVGESRKTGFNRDTNRECSKKSMNQSNVAFNFLIVMTLGFIAKEIKHVHLVN